MISKTHTSVQKLRGRQLNAKVCGSESAIFLILSFFFFFRYYIVVVIMNCSIRYLLI